MSEFTQHSIRRTEELTAYLRGIATGEKGSDLVEKYGLVINNYTPADVIGALDNVLESDIPLEDVKIASNKLFNLIYKSLAVLPVPELLPGTLFNYLVRDNEAVSEKLKSAKVFVKQINLGYNESTAEELRRAFEEIEKFCDHYTLMQNIVFPVMEKKLSQSRCVSLMWSFHDDIKRNIKKVLSLLNPDKFDVQEFNKIIGLVYFNISTIILREEKVIIPVLLDILDGNEYGAMLKEAEVMGLPFVKISSEIEGRDIKPQYYNILPDEKIVLPTGELTPEQLIMIFGHLPVDITYVDENDTVRFFSNPPHRIFPRTAAIIGRKVQNCHPPESVHIVNEIIEAFKNGDKNIASFWIHMGPKYVLIQYFAVRNSDNRYKGILEVSQEISDIQKINGERRLLDW